MFNDARGIDLHSRSWGGCWIITPAGTTNEQQADNIIDFDANEYPPFKEHSFKDKYLNIAILEMIVFIRGVYAFLSGPHAPQRHPNDPPTHIHILTDNEVAFHRALKNKGTHHIVPFLLRELSFLQHTFGVVLTYGKIKSEDNWFTDAGSRNWQTKSGPRALRALGNKIPNRLLPTWWIDLQAKLDASHPTG
jgi:hypothetical protein